MSGHRKKANSSEGVSVPYFPTLLWVRPVKAHRRNETQQLGEFAHSVLAHSPARERIRATARNVSFFAALQPRMPKTGMVTFQSATEKVAEFLALPRYPNRGRAIIVIYEWWGLNKWVKKQATNLAANGYVALAVDLYQGKLTSDPSEARKLKRGLPRDRAVRDLKAAFDYLARRPDVDPKHIGSLG